MDEVDEQPVGALTMVWVRRSLQKVRAGLMAGVCLGAVAAHATDATWSPDAANNNWTDGANWVSNPPHVVPDGIATFGASSKTFAILQQCWGRCLHYQQQRRVDVIFQQ
jgi:hypothetical protein